MAFSEEILVKQREFKYFSALFYLHVLYKEQVSLKSNQLNNKRVLNAKL